MTIAATKPTTFTYREISLQDRLREVAREVGIKPALLMGDRVVTYAELDAATDRLAAALAKRGVKNGDRVTIFMPNSVEFVFAFYGTLKAGGVVNPINALSKEREVRFQVDDAGAAAVLYHEALAPVVDAVRGDLRSVRAFAVTGQSAPSGVERFDDLVAEAGSVSVRTGMEDLAALPYTSGTTGFPKGVMLTHANLTANQQQFFAAVPVHRSDVFLNVLPFFHIYALNLLMAGSISLGATQVVMPRFDMAEYCTLIERHRATVCFIVPPIVLGLAMSPEVSKHDFSSVRFFFSGAAPLAPDPARRMIERIGKPLIQGYGLTETSPVTHTNPVEEAVLESIGPAVPGTLDKIVDLDAGTRTLTTGEVGEICVRGPQVMLGYWNSASKGQSVTQDTADVIRDGWFHTGDVGKKDEKGYVFIVDRKKEFIKYKGFGVGPAEVEAVLCEHPAVADAGVIGKADEEAGEIPKAFVQLRPNAQATADELIAFVRERIADYKRVREVEFVEKVPRTASGKILRRELAERERGKAKS
ncbi:MAG TPA: AMP-binding protein [Candidatus Limnocylindria bacterium]|jgi:long-chain acyl-CoA synthetase|nr:AMP-binding protein [Candidatus Limnocylindria bacterium]